MFKKIFVFVLASNLIFPLSLMAKERRGAELIVQIKGGQQVKGELITIKRDALLLLNPEGADVGVDIDDISVITIVKKSKAGKGALYGFGLGATSGALDGLLSEPTGKETTVGLALFGGIFFGAIGALTGGIVGALVGIDKKIQIEGKSEAEIKVILEDLRSKARVRDFQ